jgi:hypothetical protein
MGMGRMTLPPLAEEASGLNVTLRRRLYPTSVDLCFLAICPDRNTAGETHLKKGMLVGGPKGFSL